MQCCRALARMVFLDTEVFKVSSQNSISFLLSSRSSTLQIQAVVILEVFKVFTQDVVRCSALMSRPLTFQLVAANNIFSQNRVSQRLPQSCLKCCCNRFSHFSAREKSVGSIGAGQCGAGCAPQLIHAARSSNACHGS